jgi:hypothetical protein
MLSQIRLGPHTLPGTWELGLGSDTLTMQEWLVIPLPPPLAREQRGAEEHYIRTSLPSFLLITGSRQGAQADAPARMVLWHADTVVSLRTAQAGLYGSTVRPFLSSLSSGLLCLYVCEGSRSVHRIWWHLPDIIHGPRAWS